MRIRLVNIRYPKRLLSFLLVILLLFLVGCTVKEPMAEPIIKEEGSQGFLWKVENKDNVVYLLGSIHAGREDMYPLRSTILKAYEAADYLYIEANLARELEWNDRLYIGQNIKFTDKTTIKDVIPDELFQILKDRLQSINYNIDDFLYYKPGRLAYIFQPNYLEMGYSIDYGIDMYFINKAMEDNKEIVELEGKVFLFDVIDSFSLELQITELKHSLNHEDSEFITAMEAVIQSWINGDKEVIQIENELFQIEEYHDKMLRKRNERVTDIIQGLLEGDEGRTYFVVYGAGHFLLEDNVIEMLRQKGYKVIEQ